MPDDFKDAPQSISELRAKRSEDCADWTPRDVLVHVLREIDSGAIKPERLVVAFTTLDDDGREVVTYYQSAKGFLTTVGMLDRVRHMLHRDMNR